jgi:hypothetical protein
MSRAKDKYKNKLYAARQKSWDNFAKNDLRKNPWGMVYKLVGEKIHRTGVLGCLTRSDGSTTLSVEETMTPGEQSPTGR